MLMKVDLQEIVMAIVGPIEPTGDHGTDMKRLENLKALTELVDRLIYDIDALQPHAHRQEASMKAIGEHAVEFLDQLRVQE